tara:strand:- start:6 stop:797 length:792 start_codon:yes stop_codon:yes gene_type:complete
MDSFNSHLKKAINKKQSWLCVGLDINPGALNINDLESVKKHTFKVIDATREFAVAYKPNFAFFERWGSAGFKWLEDTVSYIGDKHIKIADAKRGDIGNTARQYSKSIFNHFGFDSVTINPYMGRDSIIPFINQKEKGAFILCRTSNNSAKDFQDIKFNNMPLYENVASLIKNLNKQDNLGLVVGATAPKELKNIRNIASDLPILIPGIGAQGGNLEKSLLMANKTGVGIINISRGISFIDDMSEKAIHSKASNYVKQMREILN